ncbi:MAG: D-alanine--D-alanine ligase [Gemmatimonadota bacterium]|nr:MAG: D-alanine--D-alanine ligase [Gemmatimonadota bacterium]
MKVVVLLGGDSAERDVSLASGVGVADALRKAGHEVVALDPARGLLTPAEEESILAAGVAAAPPAEGHVKAGTAVTIGGDPAVADADVVFVALHGGRGEDGTVQALLELAGVAFVGSGMLGCALAMDKDVSKRLLRDAGLPTPDWMVGDPSAEEVVERLGCPVIVKPVSGGSSIGLTLAADTDQVASAGAEGRARGEAMIFEAFVEGRELTVGILGDEALPVGEIATEHGLFDYECKYQAGMASEIFPADLKAGFAQELQRLSLEVHRALHLRHYSRIDFMLDGAGSPWILEANALPGLTGASLLPKAARAAGLSFPEFCDSLVQLARTA